MQLYILLTMLYVFFALKHVYHNPIFSNLEEYLQQVVCMEHVYKQVWVGKHFKNNLFKIKDLWSKMAHIHVYRSNIELSTDRHKTQVKP